MIKNVLKRRIIRNFPRVRENRKVISFIEEMLKECEKRNFTLEDMQGLILIFPEFVDESIAKIETDTKFKIQD